MTPPPPQLPTRDSRSGFLGCIVARRQGFISAQQLTVPLKPSGTSPKGPSRGGGGRAGGGGSRRADLAASSESGCLRQCLVAAGLCVSSFTVHVSVGRIESRHSCNLVKGGCLRCGGLNVTPEFGDSSFDTSSHKVARAHIQTQTNISVPLKNTRFCRISILFVLLVCSACI